ncbi:hypothetical protein [Brevundimonas denitrificans]|uniref:hypothetical protein n=1 Tax=Brevundimonas denitrificans TaxID=1443434 RepID=UPI00223BE421|nr:hypothetical protein [Brevundimonas denitrificans]
MRDQILEQRDRLEERGFAARRLWLGRRRTGLMGSGRCWGRSGDALLRIEARLGEKG